MDVEVAVRTCDVRSLDRQIAEVGDTSGKFCAFTRSLFRSGFVGGVACVSFLLISIACLVADEYFDGSRDELVVFAFPIDGRHEVGVGDDILVVAHSLSPNPSISVVWTSGDKADQSVSNPWSILLSE